MKVIAAAGIAVPQEESPRKYITDAEAVEVPETAYYLRRIADGDLYEATGSPVALGKASRKTAAE